MIVDDFRLPDPPPKPVPAGPDMESLRKDINRAVASSLGITGTMSITPEKLHEILDRAIPGTNKSMGT